jgi:hypothetical protein
MRFSRQSMDRVDSFGAAAHVRLSMAWRAAFAPINNASPNSEMALTEQLELLYGNVPKNSASSGNMGRVLGQSHGPTSDHWDA